MITKDGITERGLNRIVKLLLKKLPICGGTYSENGRRLNETMVRTPVSYGEEGDWDNK